MSEEVRRRMFDPFFTTKAIGAGTGLGMSMTHSVIKKHGGAINVVSEKDKGTEVKIYLPL